MGCRGKRRGKWRGREVEGAIGVGAGKVGGSFKGLKGAVGRVRGTGSF
jgi:hypothetical protein